MFAHMPKSKVINLERLSILTDLFVGQACCMVQLRAMLQVTHAYPGF